MSATPTVVGRASRSTSGMLRKLFTAPISSGSRTTSVGRLAPHFSSASAARLVAGSSKLAPSSTATLPRAACTESAARSARRRALRFTLIA